MPHDNLPLYYISAAVAITGTVGYHNLVKRIPATMDPIVSIIGIYVGVIVVGLLIFPFVSKGQVLSSLKQFGWVQIGIAICITLMEWGFILMYRSGWDLSVGNVVTGVIINLALMGIGVFFLREDLNKLNIAGILLCIAGVALIGYRKQTVDIGVSAAGPAAAVATMSATEPSHILEPRPAPSD